MAEPYTRNKRNLPVAFKPCPKCGGSGCVPTDGKEMFRQQSLAWAKSVHGKVVRVPFLKDGRKGRDGWIKVLGLAISQLRPNGYSRVKVYISVDVPPNWGGFSNQYRSTDDYDDIGGHRFYYLNKGFRSEVELVDCQTVPPELLALVSGG